MIEKLIFEIPIYRVSPEKYAEETNKLLQKQTQPDKAWHIDSGLWESISDDEKRKWQNRWERSFYQSFEGRNWQYNDLVGFIGLFAGKLQIKAEYWFIDAKRVSRGLTKRRFVYRDKLFEVWVQEDNSSQIIQGKIRSELTGLGSHFRLKNRYIDLEAFDNVASYINWRLITVENHE